MGTNTDPYQKAEGKYHLTRGIIETLGRAANPFSVLTKSTLVFRDLDVLTVAAGRSDVSVNLSIGTIDREVWRLTEPGTPPPDKRVEAVRRLNAAGVATGVLVAPVLPGLSDTEDQLRAVVGAAWTPGRCRSRRSVSTCGPGSGTTGWAGWPRPGPIWSPSTGPGSPTAPTSPTTTRPDWPTSCGPWWPRPGAVPSGPPRGGLARAT